MSPSSKYIILATSRLSTIKAKITQHREDLSLPATTSATSSDSGNAQQNWKQWARKLTIRRKIPGRVLKEEVVLFPGWAARRYEGSKEAFEVDVFVSGYASARRPGLSSRSQRAFLRLAKGFASLPKLVSDLDYIAPLPLTPSTEKLLSSIHLPPRPSEMTEEDEIKVLEQQFRELNSENQDNEPVAVQTSTPSPTVELDIPRLVSSFSLSSTKSPSITNDLRRLHANLESRLQPFWSTALSARTIRIQLFASGEPTGSESTHHHHNKEANGDRDGDYYHEPIVSRDVQTATNGFFSAKLTVSWEEMCRHPGATHIAFGDPGMEHDMYIEVGLLPSSCSIPPPPPVRPGINPMSGLPTPAPTPLVPGEIRTVTQDNYAFHRAPTVTSTLFTPLTHSQVRVISDIDDTIKFSNILSGARAVFRNVFVKELSETTIPGMGEWYDEMWKRGVRFHYVSNGPFELLPVVNEFIHISRLPPGSIKLKSYSGRSLFNGLLSDPASRKRGGVIEILDAFPSSSFILVGDTGEQDLELYAALAAERPTQIVGVFVRDVNAVEALLDSDAGAGAAATDTAVKVNSIDDPTGLGVKSTTTSNPTLSEASGYFTSGPLSAEPETYSPYLSKLGTPTRSGTRSPLPPPPPPPPLSLPPSSLPSPPSPSSPSSSPSSPSSSSPPLSRVRSPSSYSLSSASRPRKASLPEPEKRRYELQTRVWLARRAMPGHIPLRVFRRPQECVEAWDILERLMGVGVGR